MLMVGFTDLRAQAQGLPVVRDTEIENTIRAYCAPIFKVAGLDISAVRIRLINSPTLNAFVAGGQNIFVNLGLLSRSDNAGQVIGVLAHETGHITGGHLARLQEGLRNATAQSIIAMILGGAAAVASGEPQAVGGAILGGQTIGQRALFKYTRGMEQAADQAAVDFLDRAGMSSDGLLEFLRILKKQSELYTDGRDPYATTHPLTQDRVAFLENHIRQSPHTTATLPQQFETMHARMRGKINGYVDDPARTLDFYKPDDPRIEARYARAYAYMKLHEVEKALAIVEHLISESPKDPFFHELKGDIHKDAGQVREAVAAYENAVAILPWAALIRISLARMQIELNDPKIDDQVVKNVKEALRYETELPAAWRALATVYGRRGDTGKASLALAEEAMLRGDAGRARHSVERALKTLPPGTPEHIRAQDIKNELGNEKRRDNDS